MSLSKLVTKGKVTKPEFTLIHGIPGVGKTTYAADAPEPIFLPTEDGTSQFDVARFPEPKTWAEAKSNIQLLLNEKHTYKTLAIDSLDGIEKLIFDQVSRDEDVASIEKIGYAKGYIFALEYWNELVDLLQALRNQKKMNVILICHSKVKEFKDPRNDNYERFMLKLHEKAAALMIEKCETVLFASYEVHTRKDDKGRTRAVGDGSRMLYTEWRPAFDAKNRDGLEPSISLSWADYIAAKEAALGNEHPTVLKRSIEEVLKQVSEETKPKVVESITRAGDDPQALAKILNRLRTLTNAA